VRDVRLSKLHATGNDFLVRVGEHPDDVLDAVTVAALCDRRRGVGADGLITIGGGGSGHDCSMLLQNADGGVAEMSGNGIRCLAWVAERRGLARGDRLTVATGGGRRDVTLSVENGEVVGASVDMGPARFGPDVDIDLDGRTMIGVSVDMGNPHVVLAVDDPDAVDVARHGATIEHDPRFPNRINVEFARARGRDRVQMRVWERGVGETLSCGTGVCAAAAAMVRAGDCDPNVTVQVPGGALRVTVAETITLAGPVVHVFDLDIDRERLLATLR
jgi:diaminopimelate epimerase